MDNIYLIIGPSGCGKSSVCDAVAKALDLSVVSSYTDRPRRSADEHGHIFLSKEEFNKLNNFCAYTEFDGYRYGVTADIIENSDIYIIDPNGVEFFLREYTGRKKPVVIGLSVDKEVCKERMLARGDGKRAVESRLRNDESEFRADRILSLCDYIIKNDNFDHTVAAIESIIQTLAALDSTNDLDENTPSIQGSTAYDENDCDGCPVNEVFNKTKNFNGSYFENEAFENEEGEYEE